MSPLVIIIIAASLILVGFLLWQNIKDARRYRKQLMDDYPKPRKDKEDPDPEPDL